MDAVFPIAQREGDAYHTLSDFTKLFDQAKSGRYLIGQGYGWHSGVHLTSKMLPWGKGLRPIQAMLDGKIVAFRIHSDYQVAAYQDQEFKYSNNFVLIEHEAVNPEDSEDVFKFHTLYMHLAPPSDIGANSSITTRYRLQEARNVRTFKHSDVPTNSGEKKQSMSKGTLLEYLYAEEKETHPYQIGKNTYKMIKCRVVENGESPNGGEQAMLNKIVWFASGLNSDFDILEDSSAVLSEPVSEPQWMSDNAAMIRDGSVVSLHTTLFSGGIKVSAGEDIGYMGLQEYSNDAIGTKKDDNRVHIEMFSFEEPPEFFKKQISPKNAEENPLVILDGTDSSGAVDMSNSFIQQLLESVTEDQVTDFSSFTARDAKVYLDGKRKHFERFIVKHPTDWHTESSQSLYESIHQTAKEALDIKCSAGFVTEEDYRNSPWRAQVMDSFDLFSQFELERADKFSWMQDLQGDLQLSGDKSLWHYWPFSKLIDQGKYVCNCDILVQCTRWNRQYGPVVWGKMYLHQIASVWNDLQIDGQAASEREISIIEKMSPNEGRLDAVQSYDSELITAGTMQKTIKVRSLGELGQQILDFKERNLQSYKELFEDKGWYVSSQGVYFQHEKFHSGEKLEGVRLKNAIREMCSESTFRQHIDCLPIKNMACAVGDERFVRQQARDFVKRLRTVESLRISSFGLDIKTLFKSEVGIAVALDHHINRPGYVVRDITKALNDYFSLNSNISKDILSWTNESHNIRESEILDIYGKQRVMTDAENRFKKILRAF